MVLINGSSKRGDKYLEIARTLAEILIANPQKILGVPTKELADRLQQNLKKKTLYFNLCLDLGSLVDGKGDVDEADEAVLGELYANWKDVCRQNFRFFCMD